MASRAEPSIGFDWTDETAAMHARAAGSGVPQGRRSVELARMVRICAIATGLAAGALGLGFFAFIASLDRIEREPAERADGIVVLTGGSQRIGDAIDLLAKGYGSRLLISGVNERTSRDVISRLNAGQQDLFRCCVDLDYRARNTIGNAIETRRWLKENRFRSLIVVTSTYHMPRALAELDHAVPGASKVPFAVVTNGNDPGAWWQSLATTRLLALEYGKYLLVWLRTRMEKDPETSPAARWMEPRLPLKRVAEHMPPV
jgi:uncharacterized SAM-binding protein YcdF (DUF218 family)